MISTKPKQASIAVSAADPIVIHCDGSMYFSFCYDELLDEQLLEDLDELLLDLEDDDELTELEELDDELIGFLTLISNGLPHPDRHFVCAI